MTLGTAASSGARASTVPEGTPLPDAVEQQGGSDVLLEAVLASLGRILALSDFEC